MDPDQTQNTTSNPANDTVVPLVNLTSELEHVTQGMYKKNAELVRSNKTLSILQKIESIILSSVTDLKQVSQQVVDVIVSEADYKRVSIFLAQHDNSLYKIASSGGEAVMRAEFLVKQKFPSDIISTANEQNILVKACKLSKLQVTNSYSDVLTPDFSQEQSQLIQQTLNIKSIFVFPLIVRTEVIGVISLGLGQQVSEVIDYELDLMNRLAGVIGIALDNALLYQRIQEANAKLEQLDKLKDEFVSLASHELRTPMTVIKSYIWLLLEGKVGVLTDKQKEYLERTYTSTNRLIAMVNDMLNISRIESGRLTIEPKPMDMFSLTQEVISEMQSRAEEQGLQLLFTLPQDVVPNVMADHERIKQVLINLIKNSQFLKRIYFSKKFRTKGFTLIELLVVIGILAVLLAITLIAINPARQFSQANNTKRSSDVSAILNAVGQYAVEHHGDISVIGIPVGSASAKIIGSNTGGGELDFCPNIVPTFIAQMPVDPTNGNWTSCANYSSGYSISQSAGDHRITVTAPHAELNASIGVTR